MIKGVKRHMYFDTLAWYVTDAGCKLECTMKRQAIPNRVYYSNVYCVRITGPSGIEAYKELADHRPIYTDSTYCGFRGALHNAVYDYNKQCKQIGIK